MAWSSTSSKALTELSLDGAILPRPQPPIAVFSGAELPWRQSTRSNLPLRSRALRSASERTSTSTHDMVFESITDPVNDLTEDFVNAIVIAPFGIV